MQLNVKEHFITMRDSIANGAIKAKNAIAEQLKKENRVPLLKRIGKTAAITGISCIPFVGTIVVMTIAEITMFQFSWMICHLGLTLSIAMGVAILMALVIAHLMFPVVTGLSMIPLIWNSVKSDDKEFSEIFEHMKNYKKDLDPQNEVAVQPAV